MSVQLRSSEDLKTKRDVFKAQRKRNPYSLPLFPFSISIKVNMLRGLYRSPTQ